MQKISKFINFKVLLGLLFIGYLFFTFYVPIETEDVWWHLSTGRYIWEHGQIPHDDVFSFSEDKAPWFFTQWLGASFFYSVVHFFGLDGLKVLRALIILFVFLILFLYGRKYVPTVFLLWLIFLVSGGFLIRILIRPLIFNAIFIQCLLIILFAYQRSGNRKILAWIPLCGAIWSNIHLGSFVYGGLLIGVFLFTMLVESKFSKKILFDLGGILVLYFLSFGLSPYGFNGVLYPWKVFFIPEFLELRSFANTIAEVSPPVFILGLSGVSFFCFFITTVLSLIFNKDRQFSYWILFIFALFSFLLAIRNIEFFYLVCVYLIFQCAINVHLLKKWEKAKWKNGVEKSALFFLIIFLSFGIIKSINGKINNDGREWHKLTQIYAPTTPLKAVKFLKDMNIQGIIYNTDILGGYIIWEGFPGLRPFIDGRFLNPKLFYKYRLVNYDPAKYWPIVEKEYEIKIVMIETSMPSSYKFSEYLSKHDGWSLSFIDGSVFVFLKNGAFSLPQGNQAFQDHLKAIEFRQEDLETIKKFASAKVNFWHTFLSVSSEYVEELEEGLTLLGIGYEGAGLKRILKGLERVDDKTRHEKAQNVLDFFDKKYK